MERTVESPLGPLALEARDGALIRLGWGRGAREDDSNLLDRAAAELAAYFAGEPYDFDLPVAPEGTAHDLRVWRAMQRIPPGETRTYGEIARAIGSAAQAVGNACGRNPIPIVIPCHRIVAAGGGIGGYSGKGGVETKRFLLRLEGVGVG
ncbi:MAG: methylated-DNA--[protein]-cysteine S-methyltransferase [Defluviicoccus sp.]|nr:methylated-DNA--[protein]-cysteine S-methyltransferase [Defluviicoccus sp.]